MKKGLFSAALLLIVLFCLQLQAFAAPPPEEVERKKAESELHIIGTVVSDQLVETVEETEEMVKQIRQAEVVIDQLIHNASGVTLAEGDKISIFYTYIPTWISMVGNRQFYLYPNDHIETWLVAEDGNWKPIFGGVTVDHLSLAGDRKEPYPEPFQYNMNLFLLALLFIVVFYFSYKIVRRKRG